MSEILQNTRKVKCKILIILLTVFAMLIGSLSDLIYLLDWFINGSISYIFESLIDFDIDIFLVRTFCFFILDLTNIFITIFPCALIILYVLFLYKKFSAKFILAIVFFVLTYSAFRCGLNLLSNIIIEGFILPNSGSAWGMFDYNLKYFLKQFFINILPKLPLLLAAVLVLFGIKNKAVYIISSLFSTIPPTWWLLNVCKELLFLFFDDIGDFEGMFKELFNNWSYYLGEPLWAIGLIAITVAVMVFVIANNNLISKPKSKKVIIEDEDIKNLSTEDAFNVLKVKLNMGVITQEEYEEQRSIVINKI